MASITRRPKYRVCFFVIQDFVARFTTRTQLSQYSEWGMRGWSVLGSVSLMGSGVFISLSSWLAGSRPKTYYALISVIEC